MSTPETDPLDDDDVAALDALLEAAMAFGNRAPPWVGNVNPIPEALFVEARGAVQRAMQRGASFSGLGLASQALFAFLMEWGREIEERRVRGEWPEEGRE